MIKIRVFLILLIWIGASSGVHAIDLYVDTTTKQIFTEAGPGRERLGTFKRVEDKPAQAQATVNDAMTNRNRRRGRGRIRVRGRSTQDKEGQIKTADALPLRNRDAELKVEADNAKLISKIDALEKQIQKFKDVKVTRRKGHLRLISKVDSLEKEVKKSQNTKVTLDKHGFQVKSSDGNFKFKFGGKMHADASVSSNDHFSNGGDLTEANSGTQITKARMGFTTTLYKVWKFKTDIDFAGDQIRVKDLKLAYTGLKIFEDKKLQVTVGHQKQAFSRELLESSSDLMFMGRSMMNVLNKPVVGRAIGLNLASNGKKWTTQAGVYGDGMEENDGHDEGWGVNGRATFNPILNNDDGIQKLVHLGVAGNYRRSSDNDQVNGASDNYLTYKHETHKLSNLYPIYTKLYSVRNIKMVGLEANAVYGPFSLGGEFTRSWVQRSKADHGYGTNLDFHGWYGEAAVTLTGESRTYRNGLFRRLKPKNVFSLANGGLGAWEIAARVGGINMNDGAYKGGSMKNFSFALNWYANENVRLMFGYDRIIEIDNSPLIKRSNGGKPDGLNTFMFRTQIAI
ncbi:MAG: porin [Rhodobacterales bacterium]|nr:porin [Rhodobacterales bacterium]